MPGTARMRGLKNPFDIDSAIAASAEYLAELNASYGNLGLAAAAYNAGETRLAGWLAAGGFLPIETEDYVLDVLGEPVDAFADRAHQATIRPLDPKRDFRSACLKLPQLLGDTVAMATVTVKPWGIQVAGNFRRGAAIRQWQRVRAHFAGLFGDHEAVVSRVRSPRGRRGIYAVRIGADSRAQADAICSRLHAAGGACVVMRNR